MENPYVISAELDLANAELERIVRPERIEQFRESLDADLRVMGKETLWVSASTIKNGLEQAIVKTNLPVLSLDDRYVTSADQYLGISRGIDAQLNDVGYVPRIGYPSIEEQLAKVSVLGKEVVLSDDVLFSGEMAAWLADSLKFYGVKIGAVVVGIAVREGIEKLAIDGIDVQAVSIFDDVEDEICERDFAIVPGSGRRIESLNVNALYFDPVNGKPDKWASIPAANVKQFAQTSLLRAGNLVKPGMRLKDIGKFYGWPEDQKLDELVIKEQAYGNS